MGKLKNYFENVKKIENINQSFLICNTKFDSISLELKEIIDNCILNNQNVDETNIMIIKPEKNVISKDKIILLQNKLLQTSQIYNKKIYIIDECEKMNASAYNSLLKFLEEPEKNIYAFLITNNLSNVASTIKSRCFILQISSDSDERIDDINDLNLIIQIIDNIEENKIKTLVYESQDIKQIDREKFTNLIKYLKIFYMDVINYNYKQEIEVFKNFKENMKIVLKLNNLEMLTKKVLFLNDIQQKFTNNLNIALTFDKIVIGMEKINNEFSDSKVQRQLN